MTTLTLFDSQSGPETSDAFELVWDEDLKDRSRRVSIQIRSAAWNAASVTVEESHDGTNFAPYQVWDGTAMQTVTVEANTTLHIEIPLGVQVRLNNADTGSPLTAVSATASGPIKSAA